MVKLLVLHSDKWRTTINLTNLYWFTVQFTVCLITPQKLIITLRTLWTIIWTTVTIMPLTLDPKVVAAVNGTSPPLPFVFLPQGNHSVSLQYSTSWAVDTIIGSTVPIMSRRLDTNVPDRERQQRKDIMGFVTSRGCWNLDQKEWSSSNPWFSK